MPQRHLLEHGRQREEHQTRTSIGADTVCKASREDNETRHDGNQSIEQGNVYRFARKLSVARYVAAKNRHGTNADRKHEHGLAHSGIYDLGEAGIGVVEQVVEIGQQVEFQSRLTAL